MSIREHCISSLFFHVIGILLVAAALSHSQTSGFHALKVSLSPTSPGMTAATTPSKAKEARESAAAASPAAVEEEAVLGESPSEARTAAEERPSGASEPMKEAEVSQATPPAVAGPGQDLSGLAVLHHIYAVHTRVFVEKAALSLQEALHKEIEGDLSGTLRNGTAEVMFYFNDAGGIAEVRGSSSSDDLMSALGRLDWQSVPAPGAYRLKMKGLHVMIKIDRGEPSFFFTAL